MPESGSFEEKKRVYFMKLGVSGLNWFKAHDTIGRLWEGPKAKRWENVSEHCLVVAARAEILAKWLALSEESRKELFGAAILHDYNKKEEIEYTGKNGRTPESFNEAYAMSTKKLVEAGFDSTTIEIADSVGYASCAAIEEVLQKPQLSEHDVARLILHYMDDYTVNTDWVMPYDGTKNELDRRMDANTNNPKYAKFAELGLYEEQRRVGALVEAKLAELLSDHSIESVDPKQLPELIDQRLKIEIEAIR